MECIFTFKGTHPNYLTDIDLDLNVSYFCNFINWINYKSSFPFKTMLSATRL